MNSFIVYMHKLCIYTGKYTFFGHNPNIADCAYVRCELACRPHTDYCPPTNRLKQRLIKPPSGREVAEEATPTRSEGA